MISDEGARDRLLFRKINTLSRKLKRLLPKVDAEAEFGWTGSFGKTRTGLPKIGPMPGKPRWWVALGYGGNGITYAQIASDIILRALSGEHRCRSLLFGVSARSAGDIGHVLAERGRKVDLVVLFLRQDLADLFGHRKLAERLALTNAIAIVTDGLIFVFEVEAQHFFRVIRRAHGLGRDGRHLAEIIDLPGNDKRMLKLIMRVRLELIGNGHVLGALEHLRIDNIGDDGLVFPREVFIEQFGETFARHALRRFGF